MRHVSSNGSSSVLTYNLFDTFRILVCSIASNSLFFPVLGVPCGRNCRCYYIQDMGNMYDCSAANLYNLPKNRDVLNNTNCQNFRNNKITVLSTIETYLKEIFHLDISNNSLRYMVSNKISNLKNLTWLNISNNSLKTLPRDIVTLTGLTQVWLSRNPFTCNCDMLWMVDWMTNFTTDPDSDVRVVQDYYQVKCEDGRPMYLLNPVQMGCFPKKLTLWQKILIGISITLTIVLVIAIIAINRRWNEVKWFMYLHFDILAKNDGEENMEDVESDILLSYRYPVHKLFTAA